MEEEGSLYWMNFFKKCGLPQYECTVYTKCFMDNRIQKDMLMELTKDYLKEMGIARMGDVIAILRQAKTAYNEYAREQAQKGTAVGDKMPTKHRRTEKRKCVDTQADTGGKKVSVNQLPNLLFEPEIVAKLSREKQLIEMTYPYISKENETGKGDKQGTTNVTSLISRETKSHIRKYLGSQVSTTFSPSKRTRSRPTATVSSSTEVVTTESGQSGQGSSGVEMDTEGGTSTKEQVVQTDAGKRGVSVVTEESLGVTEIQEVVVTSGVDPVTSGVDLMDSGDVGEDPSGLGVEVEEVVEEVVEEEESQEGMSKIVSLYSADIPDQSQSPSRSQSSSSGKRRDRGKQYNIMISQSKEMEDLRYDIGRSLLSLKNTRLKVDGEEVPKRILGVNYKKRREAAKKRLSRKSLLNSPLHPLNDHSCVSKATASGTEQKKKFPGKIKAIRSLKVSPGKTAESMVVDTREMSDIETSQAVDAIATSSGTANQDGVGTEQETEDFEMATKRERTQMPADSTNPSLDVQCSGSSRESQDDCEMSDTEPVVVLEVEDDDDDDDVTDEGSDEDIPGEEGKSRTKKFLKLPTLDMKNLTKFQYRDVIPVLLKLTTGCDRIKPDWWPLGMNWCAKKNIYDQPHISLEALYIVVRSCYDFYKQRHLLKNQPSFENLKNLDQKQFKQVGLTDSAEASEEKVKNENTDSKETKTSDETVSTSTPDSGLELTFKCTFCEEYFTREDLKVHVKIHSGDKPYKCDYCDKSFSGKGPQQSHMRIHTRTQPYKCEICESTFQNKHSLAKHVRQHSNEKGYRCVFCDLMFAEDEHLQTHLRIHAGEKPYKCERCDKTFSYSSNYKVHMRIHTGDKPYQCPYCPEQFRQLHTLKSHLSRHTGIKPFRCGLCDKQFQHKRSLQLHFKLHAANFEIEQMHAEDIPGRCDNCKTLFTAKMDLLRRVRINSTDLPYGCRECGKCFAQAEELKTHFRIHARESTFGCVDCNKREILK